MRLAHRTHLPAAAAACVTRGLAVFPIPAGQRQAPPGWPHLASRNHSQWWPADCNIGVACRASGIIVLDLDRKNGVNGIAAFARLCANAGHPWPHTFTVATPRDGLHLYFRADGRNAASTIGEIAAGIDVRGPGHQIGGYVIGPGSHVDGRPYTISANQPIGVVPPWLIALLRLADPARSGKRARCPHTMTEPCLPHG